MSGRETIHSIARNLIFLIFIVVAIKNCYYVYELSTNQLDLHEYIEEMVDTTYLSELYLSIILCFISAIVFYRDNRFGMHLASWFFIVRYSLKNARTRQYYTGPSSSYVIEAILKRLRSTQVHHFWATNNPQNSTWDKVQTLGQCCGLTEPSDWNQFRPDILDKTIYPTSCCGNQETKLCTIDHAYGVGCTEVIQVVFTELGEDIVYRSMATLIIGLVGIAVAWTSLNTSGVMVIRRVTGRNGQGTVINPDQHPQPVYIAGQQQADGSRSLQIMHGPLMA